MSFARGHGVVIPERLANWYLYKRTFPIEMSQMVELYNALLSPVRMCGKNSKHKEIKQFIKAIENWKPIPDGNLPG